MITTISYGNNADLIAEVCKLYVTGGDLIADVTYGRGTFWRKAEVQPSWCSDILPLPGCVQADFRKLPLADSSFDVVVFDPPYAHNAGVKHADRKGRYGATSSRYSGNVTTAGMYNADIMQLYREGMTEAARVLNSEGGQLWVKCKDEVERERQRWSHIYVYNMAVMELGLYPRDLFILVPDGKQAERWTGHRQWHARKEHSYLWVFQRPDARLRKLLSRDPPRLTPEPTVMYAPD